MECLLWLDNRWATRKYCGWLEKVNFFGIRWEDRGNISSDFHVFHLYGNTPSFTYKWYNWLADTSSILRDSNGQLCIPFSEPLTQMFTHTQNAVLVTHRLTNQWREYAVMVTVTVILLSLTSCLLIVDTDSECLRLRVRATSHCQSALS